MNFFLVTNGTRAGNGNALNKDDEYKSGPSFLPPGWQSKHEPRYTDDGSDHSKDGAIIRFISLSSKTASAA